MTALALYKKYLELKESDSLIEALNGLYDHGKQCNWKTPEQTEEEIVGTIDQVSGKPLEFHLLRGS